MGGRILLVVGSQCQIMDPLSFVESYAVDLHDALTSAGWEPVGVVDELPLAPSSADVNAAVEKALRTGLLLNPSTEVMRLAVEATLENADRRCATVLFAFIGHGVARGDGFFLLSVDAPGPECNAYNAFDFNYIGQRLIDFKSLDGAVFLLDACEASGGVIGAANWIGIEAKNRGRFALLVASGADKAYDGCFTRTILSTFSAGLEKAGASLLCSDLKPIISETCWRSQSQYFTYDSTNAGSDDRGLWLVHNRSRFSDCVTGRPAAGLVDQLTSGLLVTDALRTTLAAIEESPKARLRLLIGPGGSGKSTLLALLIRPALVDTLNIRDGYIKAAVFLDSSSTLESLANEMVAQLDRTLPGFTEARSAVTAHSSSRDLQTLTSFDTTVRLPLARCWKPGLVVPVVIDGLDQPRPGSREIILAAIAELTTEPPLCHVRVLAGVRGGVGIDERDELAGAVRFAIGPPTTDDLAASVTQLRAAGGRQVGEGEADYLSREGGATVGGWLIARLLAEVSDSRGSTDSDPVLPAVDDLPALVAARIESARRGCLHRDGGGSAEPADRRRPAALVDRVLALIAAAGDRPVLPIGLLVAAAASGDGDASPARVRDSVADLGALVSRGNPGTDKETLGISHQAVGRAVADQLGKGAMEWAHQALIDANERSNSDLGDYWLYAAPRHYLGVGQPDAAIDFMLSRNTDRAADNRDRWAGWVSEFNTILGPRDPATLRARFDLACWRGQAGDAAGAVTELKEVLAEAVGAPGIAAPVIVLGRNSLGYWLGKSGNVAGAIAELEDVVDAQTRLSSFDAPATLAARHNLAYWRGKNGDIARAITELEAVVDAQTALWGFDAAATLITRHHLAYWRGKNGDIARAITELEVVVGAQTRLLKVDHPDTLSTRHDLAYFRAQGGDVDAGIAQLLAVCDAQARVLGSNDPATLASRHDLAYWRARVGDLDAGIAELRAVLDAQKSALGADHPDTLLTSRTLEDCVATQSEHRRQS